MNKKDSDNKKQNKYDGKTRHSIGDTIFDWMQVIINFITGGWL